MLGFLFLLIGSYEFVLLNIIRIQSYFCGQGFCHPESFYLEDVIHILSDRIDLHTGFAIIVEINSHMRNSLCAMDLEMPKGDDELILNQDIYAKIRKDNENMARRARSNSRISWVL